jgi:hypothetical protein
VAVGFDDIVAKLALDDGEHVALEAAQLGRAEAPHAHAHTVRLQHHRPLALLVQLERGRKTEHARTFIANEAGHFSFGDTKAASDAEAMYQ